VTNCEFNLRSRNELLLSCKIATPFFATLAQQGSLEYPLFGLSLTRNTSGTLSIGMIYCLCSISEYPSVTITGAVDATVVANVSAISWHDVVPFSPFGSENNVSSYLQWTIVLDGFSVCASSCRFGPFADMCDR
jgi:hypothetical protein